MMVPDCWFAYSEIPIEERHETTADFWHRGNALFRDGGRAVQQVLTDDCALGALCGFSGIRSVSQRPSLARSTTYTWRSGIRVFHRGDIPS